MSLFSILFIYTVGGQVQMPLGKLNKFALKRETTVVTGLWATQKN